MKNKCIAIAFLIVILSSCTNKADINNVKDLANNTTIYESISLQENKQNQEIILEDVKGTSESELNEQNSDSPVDNLKSSETINLKEITSEENNDTKFIEKVRPIYNKDIVKLSDENFKKLTENNFVLDVDDINKYKEFFEIYKKNKNDKFPNFITVDSLLHTYNVYLWNLKTKIEMKKLYALFTNFSENILKTVNDYYDRLKDTEMEKDIKAIKVYFTVPLKIANKEYEVDNDIAYMVEEEIHAIDNYRDERIIRPIFNEFASEYNENVDTQDKYKSSKLRYEKIKPYYDNYKIYKVANDCGEETNLREYYKILLWYRQIKFILEDEHLTKMALLMSYALKDSGLIEEYNIELGFEKTQVNRITIKVNPDKFKLEQAANLCNTLNLYLPNYEWLPEPNLPARQCSFVGAPLPPHIAKYPGSWLRPAEFVPIGLSGLGEVSWNLNTIKNEGRSLYVYEDGKIAQTVDTPSAPQALCVGSTGGGKSVTLRNVIFHCIEHNNKISVGLIDIKQTEFYPFKGVNGVVAVANSVQEGAELLRIARAVMYSRNKKMQKIGLNDMADYKPHDWTGKIWITGREFDKDEKILVKVNGQEQEMTALQVYEYLYE